MGTAAEAGHHRTEMTDSDDLFPDEWLEPDPPPPPPRWRRRLVTALGIVVAAAMLAGPVWNVVDRATPPTSDAGLELCGFDYCVVQDAVREAGHGVTMSRLANTYLTDDEAAQFADALVDRLGVPAVTVRVVDRLDRRIAGLYEGAERRITLERPIRAWVVLHEVAHAVAAGHGEAFQETVIELADWVASESP